MYLDCGIVPIGTNRSHFFKLYKIRSTTHVLISTRHTSIQGIKQPTSYIYYNMYIDCRSKTSLGPNVGQPGSDRASKHIKIAIEHPSRGPTSRSQSYQSADEDTRRWLVKCVQIYVDCQTGTRDKIWRRRPHAAE